MKGSNYYLRIVDVYKMIPSGRINKNRDNTHKEYYKKNKNNTKIRIHTSQKHSKAMNIKTYTTIERLSATEKYFVGTCF